MRNLRNRNKKVEKKESPNIEKKKAEPKKLLKKITVKNRRQDSTLQEREESKNLVRQEIEHEPRKKKKIEKEVKRKKSVIEEKADEIKAGVCGICLENVKTQGVLDECTHTFCLQCIKKWGEIENTCPCCKRRFHTIKRKLIISTLDLLSNPSKRKKTKNLQKRNALNSKNKKEDVIKVQTRNQRLDFRLSSSGLFDIDYLNQLLLRFESNENAVQEFPEEDIFEIAEEPSPFLYQTNIFENRESQIVQSEMPINSSTQLKQWVQVYFYKI